MLPLTLPAAVTIVSRKRHGDSACGRVVYTEGPLKADAGAADEYGLRVGDEFCVVTCEMVELVDPRDALRGARS